MSQRNNDNNNDGKRGGRAGVRAGGGGGRGGQKGDAEEKRIPEGQTVFRGGRAMGGGDANSRGGRGSGGGQPRKRSQEGRRSPGRQILKRGDASGGQHRDRSRSGGRRGGRGGGNRHHDAHRTRSDSEGASAGDDDRDLLINRGQLGEEVSKAEATAGESEPLPSRPRVPYQIKQTDVEEGIRRGTHVVATMRIPKWTSGIAFAQSSLLPCDVAIGSIEGRKSALPGDLVAVKLLPRSEWTQLQQVRGSGEAHVPLGLGSKKPTDEQGAEAAAKLPDGRDIWHVVSHAERKTKNLKPEVDVAMRIGGPNFAPTYDWPTGIQPHGVVVEVLERNHAPYQCCRVFETQQQKDAAAAADEAAEEEGDPKTPAAPPKRIEKNRYYKFKPYHEGFPIICIYGRDIPSNFHDELNSYLFLAELPVDMRWVEGQRFPVGKVVRSLGRAGTVEAESSIIAFTHEIKDAPFTEEVEACVAETMEMPNVEELKHMGRRDLRQEEFVCTIDPATARDLDDALSIKKTPGGYRVGVHIADVSHFVPIDSPLDEEAKQRATSTYFVERVVPMLPRRLCEDYCSLNAGVDKFAFSCLWDLDGNGRVQSEWIGQSVIRNSCRMAYEDAQKIIDGDTSGDSLVFTEDADTEFGSLPREQKVQKVVKSVQLLYALATKLREARYARGALSLNKRKLRFIFEDMNSRFAPAGVTLESGREANWTVEELMLLANCRTAEKCVEFLPDCTLLRKHDPPQRAKMTAFVEAAKKFGFDISAKTGKGLADSLKKYSDHKDADVLKLMATMCMSLAKYANSKDDEDSSVAHYALAAPVYAHFTSPIRRYADLVTHRQLLLALDIEAYVKKSKAVGKKREQLIEDLDVSQLAHGHHYLHPEEVTLISENCNKRKEGAKQAGDASSKVFLCLYIEAMNNKSKLDPSVPSEFVVRVVVVRIKEKTFMVHCSELAQEVEIFHNAGSQKWKRPNDANEKESFFTIDWGADPKTGENVVEKATLFSDFLATVKVVTHGSLTIDFMIHPPWQRSPSLITKVLQSL